MGEYSYQNYAKHYDKRETVSRYNWKYRQNLRESDKRLIDILDEKATGIPSAKVIDLGCGNGNLLYHLKEKFPKWHLKGKDLAETIISQCNEDSELTGITFEVGDLTCPPSTNEQGTYDFVILIAVLQVLPPEIIKKALIEIYRYLKPGGWLLNFDGYHIYPEHEIVSVEISSEKHSPDLPKMTYYYPSRNMAIEWCNAAGFSAVEFEDFHMPFDIARPSHNPAATHTQRLQDGCRLSMLGIIAQPWSFLIANK